MKKLIGFFAAPLLTVAICMPVIIYFYGEPEFAEHCILANIENAKSKQAAILVQRSCNELYPKKNSREEWSSSEKNPFDQFDRKVTVTFDDGTIHIYQKVPENITSDQALERVRKDYPDRNIRSIDDGL